MVLTCGAVANLLRRRALIIAEWGGAKVTVGLLMERATTGDERLEFRSHEINGCSACGRFCAGCKAAGLGDSAPDMYVNCGWHQREHAAAKMCVREAGQVKAASYFCVIHLPR